MEVEVMELLAVIGVRIGEVFKVKPGLLIPLLHNDNNMGAENRIREISITNGKARRNNLFKQTTYQTHFLYYILLRLIFNNICKTIKNLILEKLLEE